MDSINSIPITGQAGAQMFSGRGGLDRVIHLPDDFTNNFFTTS